MTGDNNLGPEPTTPHPDLADLHPSCHGSTGPCDATALWLVWGKDPAPCGCANPGTEPLALCDPCLTKMKALSMPCENTPGREWTGVECIDRVEPL